MKHYIEPEDVTVLDGEHVAITVPEGVEAITFTADGIREILNRMSK